MEGGKEQQVQDRKLMHSDGNGWMEWQVSFLEWRKRERLLLVCASGELILGAGETDGTL